MKPVLHSVSYSGVWRGQPKLTVDEFLVQAPKLGYEAVMLVTKRPHVSPLDYDEEARKRLRQKIESLGLELTCLAGYTDFTGGIDRAGIPVPEIQAAYVGELARLARDLNCPMLRVFTGYERAGIPFDRQWGIVVDGLRLASHEAAKYGITLAVQNHHDLANHHDALYWLLSEINEPNCKAAFDAWTPALQGLSGEELAGAVRKMAPFIVHTTVADYVRLPRFRYDINLVNFIREDDVVRAVPAGTGIIDYESFFQALKEIDYRGPVAYEMCEVLEGGPSMENLQRCAKRFLEFMSEVQGN